MTTSKMKWHLAAKKKAEDHLSAIYPNRFLINEIVSDNDVIYIYNCGGGPAGFSMIQVLISRKNGKADFSTFELSPI